MSKEWLFSVCLWFVCAFLQLALGHTCKAGSLMGKKLKRLLSPFTPMSTTGKPRCTMQGWKQMRLCLPKSSLHRPAHHVYWKMVIQSPYMFWTMVSWTAHPFIGSFLLPIKKPSVLESFLLFSDFFILLILLKLLQLFWLLCPWQHWFLLSAYFLI